MTSSIPVSVVAQPEFIGQHGDKFAFSYTIYITNRSNQTITLQNRHWIITHADGRVKSCFFQNPLQGVVATLYVTDQIGRHLYCRI